MSGAHEPRQEFVNDVELLLRADLRRRALAAGTGSWLSQSRFAAALTIAAVAIVSMVVGGGVVATAYETRLNEQRDLLLDTFEQRALVAKQRLALAMRQLRDVQGRVSVGIEPQEAVRDMQYTVTEAEAEVKSVELDIAEIRATGREPVHALSAPLDLGAGLRHGALACGVGGAGGGARVRENAGAGSPGPVRCRHGEYDGSRSRRNPGDRIGRSRRSVRTEDWYPSGVPERRPGSSRRRAPRARGRGRAAAHVARRAGSTSRDARWRISRAGSASAPRTR